MDLGGLMAPKGPRQGSGGGAGGRAPGGIRDFTFWGLKMAKDHTIFFL